MYWRWEEDSCKNGEDKKGNAIKKALQRRAYSDVEREAQEIVELALRAMLCSIGIEPAKFHDVGSLLLKHRENFSEEVGSQVERLAGVFKRLKKERKLYFFGDIDFIPSEEYKLEDAQEARESAYFVVSLAKEMNEQVG